MYAMITGKKINKMCVICLKSKGENFNQLKNLQWNVQMERNGSLDYRIFMILPASAFDTV